MKKLILIAIILLQGCAWQTVTSDEIKMATSLCKAQGAELSNISPNFAGTWSAICSNLKRVNPA